MRIVFMGTPKFAVPSLKILLDNNHPVVAVVTVPDKPQGRGQKIIPSPIKTFALQHNLTIFQPESLKDHRFISQLGALQPDLLVVVAFRILPKEVFTVPKHGAFNLHASLLPKYRGAAPIQWAIINGEKETGVTTFYLKETVDTGNIILQARVPIGPDETFGELHDKLADIGAEIVLHSVRLIEMGKATPRPQNEAEASSAPKILKEQCRIDWTKPAHDIHNLVRGLSPSPGAYATLGKKTLKIYRTIVHNATSPDPPGTVWHTDGKFIVSTGDGSIQILELQPEGKRRMSAAEFLRGNRLEKGTRLS